MTRYTEFIEDREDERADSAMKCKDMTPEEVNALLSHGLVQTRFPGTGWLVK